MTEVSIIVPTLIFCRNILAGYESARRCHRGAPAAMVWKAEERLEVSTR
jgi:hypothetical protein